jgi:DNA-binding IclR family transcriptional regulator
MYRSTILRLARTLCECGFLTRLSDGTFRLGSALLHLGSIYENSFRLEEIIVPALTELMRETGETATFYVRQGDKRVCLFRVDSPQPLREHLLPGESRPIDATATGQVFKRMEGKTQPFKSLPPSYSEGVYDPFTASSAVPLITASGAFLGVLTISGPSVRFTLAKRKAAGEHLIEVAGKLGSQLGGPSNVTGIERNDDGKHTLQIASRDRRSRL